MNNKMGYILISIGIALLVWGIAILTKHKTTQQPKHDIKKSVDIDDNKAKGDAFERFVVKNFDKKYFTIQEWRSDKYVDGIYAVSNHFPDLEVIFELKSKGIREVFAIECKWRRSYYQEAIEWAKDYQLNNYKEYADRLKIPVFVLIGVGGEPEKPQELFIVPLPKLKSNTISKPELAKYKKDLAHYQFFWDSDKNELR